MHASAAPAWELPRNRLALGCTCAAHLLAALLWMQQRPMAPAPDTARQREFFAIVLAPAVPAAPRPSATPPVRAAAPARPAARPAAAPAAAILPAAAAAEPAPAVADDAAGEDAPAPDASAAGGAGFTLGLARRQAGRIDRELRKGKSGVPTEADTPWGRFQRGVESAYIDRSKMLLIDTYTAPDGVVIYRFRQGNSVRCTRSGSVGVLPSSMGEAGTAGSVHCPSGVAWKRE